MKIDLGSGEICLRDNQPLRLDGARGLRIECMVGMIWITETGHPDDIFLSAGQSYRLAGNGISLVESIGDGRIRLAPPARRFRLPRPAARKPLAFPAQAKPA